MRTPFAMRTVVGTLYFDAKRKKKDHRMMVFFLWQRNRDSNPNIQSQSLLCYLYTIPLYSVVWAFLFSVLRPTYRVCRSGKAFRFRVVLCYCTVHLLAWQYTGYAESAVLPLHNSAKTSMRFSRSYILAQLKEFVKYLFNLFLLFFKKTGSAPFSVS